MTCKCNMRDLWLLADAQGKADRGQWAHVFLGYSAARQRLARRGLVTNHGVDFTVTEKGSAMIDKMILLLNEVDGDDD